MIVHGTGSKERSLILTLTIQQRDRWHSLPEVIFVLKPHRFTEARQRDRSLQAKIVIVVEKSGKFIAPTALTGNDSPPTRTLHH